MDRATAQGQAAVWVESQPLAGGLRRLGFAYVGEYAETKATFVRQHLVVLRMDIKPRGREQAGSDQAGTRVG